MRRPFPNKKSTKLESQDASLTYFGFGSAGGNPDTRADTHMWTFSFTFPARKTLFITRREKVLSGLISISCPTYYCAWKHYKEKHGKDAWVKLGLTGQFSLSATHFQAVPQHLFVGDVDDPKQSLDWSGLSGCEKESALTALIALIFRSQSSFALNNEDAVAEDCGMYADTLRVGFSSQSRSTKRCFLAPKIRDQTPSSHQEGEVLPRHFLC